MKSLQACIIFSFILSISCYTHIEPVVLVHGGADQPSQKRVQGRKEGVKEAAMIGYKILKKGGSVADAVEAAVKYMEDNVNFNAGYGSVLNIDGEVEMDACIMIGSNFSSGAVSGIKNVKNPISLARMVMEKSPHFLLSGEGAKRFAKDKGMPLVSSKQLIADHAKEAYHEYMKSPSVELNYLRYGCGGIGAVAIDSKGHMAAATSTGGRIAKLPGRASDAAIVGAGIYVDDEVGAVVVTGHGEAIARYVMAHEIINLMKKGFEAGVATRLVVKGITEKFHKPTGALVLSRTGQIGISFTTEKMAWAYQIRENVHYGVDDYDHFNERIKI